MYYESECKYFRLYVYTSRKILQVLKYNFEIQKA